MQMHVVPIPGHQALNIIEHKMAPGHEWVCMDSTSYILNILNIMNILYDSNNLDNILQLYNLDRHLQLYDINDQQKQNSNICCI
jgi:hypothetical protein